MRAALTLALLTLAAPVQAAQFTVGAFAGSIPIIDVSGQIFDGDEQRFKLFAEALPFAVVRLSSPGGHLLAALTIGEMVHARGFATYVSPGQVCASSCGLLWLAGQPRGMSPTAKVGFHAAFATVDGRKEENGAANAVVGAYMTKLHLNLGAVIWATMARPDQMGWLTPDLARTYDIAFDARDEVETTHWAASTPPAQTVAVRPSAPMPLPGAQPPAPQVATSDTPSGATLARKILDAPQEVRTDLRPRHKPPKLPVQAQEQPGLIDALGDLVWGHHSNH